MSHFFFFEGVMLAEHAHRGAPVAVTEVPCVLSCLFTEVRKRNSYLGPDWQGSGSSVNGSGSGSSDGVAFLMELKPFWKMFGKTASPVGLRL
jgi:hypothetical protein